MGPVTREEFNALVQKAIQTPGKKTQGKSGRSETLPSANE
jgi:hypothetical protein